VPAYAKCDASAASDRGAGAFGRGAVGNDLWKFAGGFPLDRLVGVPAIANSLPLILNCAR